MEAQNNLAASRMILESPNVVCENCGSRLFTQAFVLKKISALVSPTGTEQLVEIPLYVCKKCGEVPSYYRDKSTYKTIMGLNDTEEKSGPAITL